MSQLTKQERQRAWEYVREVADKPTLAFQVSRAHAELLALVLIADSLETIAEASA